MLRWEDGTACMRDPRISKNPDRRGKGWKGRKERDWEKLAHITVCIFTDTCTFAPWILEKDDYLHRDTFSLSQLVYLLIYFLVLRVYPPLLPLAAYLRLSRRIFSPFFFFFFSSFFFSFFSYSYSLPPLSPFQILLFLVPPRSGGKFLRFIGIPSWRALKFQNSIEMGREKEKNRWDETSHRWFLGYLQVVILSYFSCWTGRWNFVWKHNVLEYLVRNDLFLHVPRLTIILSFVIIKKMRWFRLLSFDNLWTIFVSN